MKLTLKNILSTGFFFETVPIHLFSSKEVYKLIENSNISIEEIIAHHKSINVFSTPCTYISMYKNDTERRIIGLPHIENFILLCNEIEFNKEKIQDKLDNSQHSFSNKIKPYSIENYIIKSSFRYNYLEKINYSLGYRYFLKLDISKCYENIYTHSISWALLGKKTAKQEYKLSASKRSNDYKNADKLDEFVRRINNNETKGIPTGPLSSRIISELILTEIDSQLSKEKYTFKRYVDDYSFYFMTKQEAEIFIPKFQTLLYEYKFHINSSKTIIEKFPYNLNHNLNVEIGKNTLNAHGYINYLNKCFELHSQGNKGALKYGLKVISNEFIDAQEKELVFSLLINTLITYPNLADIIFKILKKNNFKSNNHFNKAINRALSTCLRSNHELEVIWILSISLEFNIELELLSLNDILTKSEVFSTIISLNYIHLNSLYNVDSIKLSIKNLKSDLQSESIYGDKWLLIYECARNKWITGLNSILKKSKFFEECINQNVKFYKTVYAFKE